jgi:hypothetical protein
MRLINDRVFKKKTGYIYDVFFVFWNLKCININFQSQSGRQFYIFFLSQIKLIFLLDLLLVHGYPKFHALYRLFDLQ